MIWTYLKIILIFLGKLIIPPPAVSDPIIDPNDKCPACGGKSGELRTIMDAKQTILVQHHCKICGARWHEKPILEAKGGVIIAANVNIALTND